MPPIRSAQDQDVLDTSNRAGAPERSVEQLAGARHPLLWAIVGIALGIGLLYASTRKLDLTALATTLRSVEWPWVCLVFGVTPAFCAIKAWRWGLLLRFVPGLRFRELHSAVYIGLATNFLVAHLGELLRAATVANGRGVALSTVLASVVIERVLDFIAILALLTLIVALVPDPPPTVTMAAAASAAFIALAIVALYAMLHPPGWITQLATRLSADPPGRLRRRIAQILGRFRAGLAPLHSPGLMLFAILISVLQWALVMAAIWTSGLAVTESVSLIAATVTFVLIVLGLTLPNSPMQIGATQLAFVVGLGTDGTDATAAIAASLVYTTFLIIPVMLAGALLVVRGRADVAILRRVRNLSK